MEARWLHRSCQRERAESLSPIQLDPRPFDETAPKPTSVAHELRAPCSRIVVSDEVDPAVQPGRAMPSFRIR